MEPLASAPVLESGRSTHGPGGPSFFRALLPREHGLIAWVVQPLWLGWLLAHHRAEPTVATVGILLGFGAFNAFRSGHTRAGVGAAGGAALVLVLGMCGSAQPLIWAAFAVIGASALILGRSMRQLPRQLFFESVGLAMLCGAGVLVAHLGGAETREALAAGTMLLAWEIIGLCWVRGQLAKVLPRRQPVPHGAFVAFAATMTAGGTAIGLGHPSFALLPLLYGLRVVVHAPAARAADAKRIGLTELAWGLAAAVALALR